MLVTDADTYFVRTGFQTVKGWCLDDAALLTCCLLSQQARVGQRGGMFEIGVYEGKYLSVLYHCARTRSLPVLGVDTFEWSSRESVLSTFASVFGSTSSLQLIRADSRTLTCEQVIAALGGQKPAFVSVDGDHGAPAVCRDLAFAKSILAEGGVIAVDDFLNPRAIGVSEGTYRFFIETREEFLRPFAYCANKLFVAESSYHDRYRRAIFAFVEEMPELAVTKEFKRLEQIGREYIEQPLLGSKTLIL